jgi:outer membrane PBP1 activator LpoA protein
VSAAAALLQLQAAQAAPPPAPPAAPDRIVLLLPLSGGQRPAAEAIRDGFLSAWLASPAERRAEVVVVDEEKPGPVEALATAGGAPTLVVGPLLKESVTRIAQASRAAPTLALNATDAVAAAGPPLFQFALAPEDEAVAVAERASGAQQRRAIALLPDNELGRRLLAAFEPALRAAGGELVAYRFYDPGGTNFTDLIRRLLLLDESEARHRALSAFLGQQLEFEPARRTDVDFILMAANPAAARLLRPQLRFLYAGDLPTYATSAIFVPGTGGDADLEGVMFPDAPMLITPDERATALRRDLERRWPAGTQQRLRFYAMGYDAWALATGVARGSEGGVQGLSGLLTVDPGRRVHSHLAWAQFHDGRITPLAAAGASPAPTQ